jgi:hypothetical protein
MGHWETAMRGAWSTLMLVLLVGLAPAAATAQEQCAGLVRFDYRYLETKGRTDDGSEWTRVERTLGMCAEPAIVNSVRGSIDALTAAINAGTDKVVSISDKAASIGGKITDLTGDTLVILASGARGAWQYVVPSAQAAQTCQPEQIERLASIAPQPAAGLKNGQGKRAMKRRHQSQRTAQN